MKTINHVAFDIINNAKLCSRNEKINRACKENSFSYKVKDVKKEIENIIHLQEIRLDSKKTLSIREHIWQPYRQILSKIAEELPKMGYSMGQYNRVCIKKTNICGYWDNAEEYAKSSKYKAIHGDLRFTLTAKELIKTKIVGALITIINQRIAGDLFSCDWISSKGSKQYFELIRVPGYIYKDYHFQASSIKEAKEIVKERRIKLANKAKLEKAEKEINKLAEQMEFNKVFVELNDSINAGNCLSGTKNFAKNHNIDLNITGAVRADFLFDNRNGSEVFVLRAINSAKRRYAQMKVLAI
jgi:hypothetical protein